jgi:hypothetical protein
VPPPPFQEILCSLVSAKEGNGWFKHKVAITVSQWLIIAINSVLKFTCGVVVSYVANVSEVVYDHIV